MTEALSKALQEVEVLIERVQRLEATNTPQSTSTTKTFKQKVTASEETVGQQSAGQSGKKGQKKADAKAAAKAAKSSAPAAEATLADSFAKARIAVGLVELVEQLPNSEKLYRCQVQVGGGEKRQIIAGLRQHIAIPELTNRLVCVILNLKTAKLAGEASEGMILAAVHKGEQYEKGELVKPLSVPGGAQPGRPIRLEGSPAAEGYPKEFKQWKKILPALAVKDSAATFNGTALVVEEGPITVDKAVPDGAAIS